MTKPALQIRPAKRGDLDQMTELMVADAQARYMMDDALWAVADTAHAKVRAHLDTVVPPGQGNIRHAHLVADAGGTLVGIAHTILLPVPPIYAGALGEPGLVMEDCCLHADAPAGTGQALLAAAEADLIAAGARILLASSVPGTAWETIFKAATYAPLTDYLVQSPLQVALAHRGTRPATPDDVPGIVTASAQHRRILDHLHTRFWNPHPDADTRFDAWMHRSLTWADRDMFVTSGGDELNGYAISQPATPLHIPAAHDVAGIGIIDDFFHTAFTDPHALSDESDAATALLADATSARGKRGDRAVLVVCPTAWTSKIALLEQAGFRTAITWHVRFVEDENSPLEP